MWQMDNYAKKAKSHNSSGPAFIVNLAKLQEVPSWAPYRVFELEPTKTNDKIK